ncbi:MAG: 1-(5-phosphoribosyl)-5-[(5-phosphoribosylamino)methylideneamino]imidazole-4-carboxamide isomerase [Hyphomonadaceae bacterium]
MILYPAIDLKGGRCVRLTEGRFDAVTVFNEDPAAQAVLFQQAGFSWLHIVDLEGSAQGKPTQAGVIAAILAAVSIPVQVAGGVRSLESIAYWLDAGATRVLLGTAAVRDPALVRAAAREFPDRVGVALDSRGGKVAVQGWTEQTDLDVVELAKRMAESPIACLLCTDIGRDGLKRGVNLQLTAAIANAVSAPVIASGGVKNAGDIAALKALPGQAVHGCILGRALYDGDIDPAEALRIAA